MTEACPTPAAQPISPAQPILDFAHEVALDVGGFKEGKNGTASRAYRDMLYEERDVLVRAVQLLGAACTQEDLDDVLIELREEFGQEETE